MPGAHRGRCLTIIPPIPIASPQRYRAFSKSDLMISIFISFVSNDLLLRECHVEWFPTAYLSAMRTPQ